MKGTEASEARVAGGRCPAAGEVAGDEAGRTREAEARSTQACGHVTDDI